jgi:arylsulfatase A-like enzyme
MYGGENGLADSRPVIQQMLKEAGYTTAAVSANPHLSGPFGWSRGFDYFDECRPEEVYRKKLAIRITNQFAKLIRIPLGWPESLPANLVFENSRAFLRNPDQPFFLWIHLMDVHWPYTIQKFTWNPEWVNKRREDRQFKTRFRANPPKLNREEHEKIFKEYRQAVSFTDDQIGRFFHFLEQADLLEGTWVVISADHGEEFLDHGLYFHHPALFDELIHVPLIISPPKGLDFRVKQRYEKQVRMIDLVPTFLDIAQSSHPNLLLQGESLLPLINGKEEEADRPAIIEGPGNQVLAYRYEGWKLIWNTQTDEVSLFDLMTDPGECLNRATYEPDRVENMLPILKDHFEKVNASRHEVNVVQQNLELDPALLEQLRNLGYVE